MKKIGLALFAVMMMSLAGCTPEIALVTYKKDGMDKDAFEKARYACLKESQRAVDTKILGFFTPPFVNFQSYKSDKEPSFIMYDACMTANGWKFDKDTQRNTPKMTGMINH